jgi:hypothetical protein
MLPGLGQFYNRDYWIGLLIIILEFSVNYLSCINGLIKLEFNNHLNHQLAPMHLYWIMFYPAIYTFGMWQAFNRSVDINQELKRQVIPPTIPPKFTGLFIGLCIGMLCGIIWPYKTFYIGTGLVFGFIGMAIGHALELLFCCKHSH